MLQDRLRAFLDEDGPRWRDVTDDLVAGHETAAVAVTREDGVAAGVEEAVATFEELDVRAEARVDDGDRIAAGDELLAVEGAADSVLRGERLALNLLGSMSGVATATRRCVDRAGDTRVAATRKTTPGYRDFEKKAVRVGGGDPHRYSLADAVLIKENHIAVVGLDAAVTEAVERASFTTVVEVEAETESQAVRAAELGADVLLLDNMAPAETGDCVAALAEFGVTVEASGGITPENVADYADAGVDVVSMGSLTHSSDWLDVSMVTR
ncbi:MAG: carboxylating nicotinate-nucleotide diphosphorylase [Halobacteriaceae archaeon]